MAATADLVLFLKYFWIFAIFSTSKGSKFCLEGYYCDKGHCCGHGRCCTYYYELWWFWVACVLLALMGTCWYFHHMRWKKRSADERVQRSLTSLETNAQDPSKVFQLPTYDELQVMPKEPPPYHQQNVHLAIISSAQFQQSAHGSRGYPLSPPLYNPDVMEPPSEPPQYSMEDTALLLNDNHDSMSEQSASTARSTQPHAVQVQDISASTSLLHNEERISN